MEEFIGVKDARKEIFFGCSRSYWETMVRHENFPKEYRISPRGKAMYRRSELIGFRETEMRAA